MGRATVSLAAVVCILGLWHAAGGDQPATQPDELRMLQTENKLLKSALEAQRKEAALLRAENARLIARLKSAGVEAGQAKPEPVPAPTTREAGRGGNEAVSKAYLDYVNRKTEIELSKDTQAQKEVAFRKARDQMVATFPHDQVTVGFEVANVNIESDTAAWISLAGGTIKQADADGPGVMVVTGMRVLVRMPRAKALQVTKGMPVVLTGALSLYEVEKRGLYRCPQGTSGLGYLRGKARPTGEGGFAMMNQIPVAVRDGFVMTLDGKRLDVTRMSGIGSNTHISGFPVPARPATGK